MSNNKPLTKDKKSPALPEERFWKRYSPHHEFPLSGVTSVALHGVIAALLVLAIMNFAWRHNTEPLPMEEVVVAGGGGATDGVGDAPGNLAPPSGKENVPETTEPTTPKPPKDANEPIKEAVAVAPDIPELDSKDERLISQAAEATKNLAKVSRDTRDKLLQGLTRGKGEGGSGSGGGKGSGKGTGEGNASGPGKGNISARQKRVLRWTMMFNTLSGDDYRKQLEALGAILGVPAEGGYRVIRNLKPPVKGEVEDLAEIKRIFWVDDKPQSVASLSQALGLFPPPPHIVAFFPESLEAKLLQKEHEYRGRSEDDIKETRFEIVRRGGSYEPVVRDQR
jgi:hypothetical protein